MYNLKQKDNTNYLYKHLQLPLQTDSLLQMGNQNNDSVVMHSSIALLQERFRQLQRAREMREERKLLGLFSESETLIATTRSGHEPTRPFFFKQHVIQPDSHRKSAHFLFQDVDTPLLTSLWPTDRANRNASNTFDEAEVDTSLHL